MLMNFREDLLRRSREEGPAIQYPETMKQEVSRFESSTMMRTGRLCCLRERESGCLRTAVLISLLIPSLLLSLACQKQTGGWKGSIERRGGLTVVKNPKAPLYGSEIFSLEKNLTIGKAEGEKEYLFSRISGVDVDDNGNVYVIDGAEAHVRVFDNKGRYLRTIGRRGQGPGETEMPVYVQITSRGGIFVYDYAAPRAVFYSLEGRFLNQLAAGRWCLPVKLDSQGNLIGLEILAPPPLGGKILKRYDSAFSLQRIIAREEQGVPKVFDIGRPALYACAAPGDNIVWGNSAEYVLYVLDAKGDLIKTIERDYNPVPITSKDKEAYRKQYEGPLRAGYKINFQSHFPAYSGIFADDGGRIFVKTYERCGETADSFYYDVFDEEGRYLAKLPIKVELNRNCVWKNHRLYAIESDEQGFQMVNRYSVSWEK